MLTCVWYAEYLYRLILSDQLLADFQATILLHQMDMHTRTRFKVRPLSNGQMVILTSGSLHRRNSLQEIPWRLLDWDHKKIVQTSLHTSKEAELSTTTKATYSNILKNGQIFNQSAARGQGKDAANDHTTRLGPCTHSLQRICPAGPLEPAQMHTS